MKRIVQFFVFLVAILAFNNIVYAQTGPGGIGNATGINGQPLNLFWLDAGDLGLTNNAPVSAWADKSGNSNNFGQSSDLGDPLYITGQINSLPIVRFSNTTGTTGTKLVRKPFNSFPGSNVSVIIVYMTTDTGDGLVSYAVSAANSNEFLLYNNSNLNLYVKGNAASSGQAFNGGGFQIATHKWRSSDGSLRMFQNGTQVYSITHAAGSTFTNGGSIAIGGEQDDVDGGYVQGQAFDGDIAEIIMFDAYVNDAQRTIIENYLNVKYGIAISNDVFALGDASYSYDVTGIGQELDGNHTSTVCGTTGFYIESAGALDNGDYIMAAHNNSANSVSTADLPGTVEERWAKDWYVEQTNSQNARIIFDLSEGITGGQYPQNISNYVLLFRSATTGNYSIATTSSVDYANADQVAFNILGASLANGYYTLGTTDQTNSPVVGAAGTTWYTLVSGNWTDPNIWTLDPSGSLPNNPTNSYPQIATDKVVIKTGKTVTMDLLNPTYSFASVTIDGRLDLTTKTGLTFDIIKGNGRILMAADVFPTYTNADNFIKAGQGEGTVVLYGSSFTLNTAHEFYNVEVEMTAGQTATLMADYTLNGLLRVKTGTFQINDNSSTTGLNVTVNGNVEITSGAFLHTGIGNARHQFNFYGDLTNNGELKFTNRAAADYINEATDGIVDANFLNSSANQSVLCNGVSNFYRIEVDKGTDKTYILSIEASTAANFNLFGYANESHASVAQLTVNDNALGLLRGTVKIGNNVVINELSQNANYNISETARLWVAGGSVYNNNGNSTVPYGTLEVSAGLMESRVASGITLRDNGLIKVSGGTINTNQIRTSVLGASNVGAYVQSGGTVNILSGATTTDYYHFCLTYTGNVFNMSGGTLHVYDANGTAETSGAIFINSDAQNINVTGGTVIAEIGSTTNPFKITSKAAFYNLILRNTFDNTTDHILDAGANVGSTNENLVAQPLVVLNDLTIESNVFFDHNGNDLTIGRNFSVAETSQQQGTNNYGYLYDAARPNTTTFNGSNGGVFYVGHNINDTYELYLWNMVVTEHADSSLVLDSDANKEAGTATEPSIVRVNNTLTVNSGTLDQGNHSIRLVGNVTVNDSGTCGVFQKGVTNNDALILFVDGGNSITGETLPSFGNVEVSAGAAFVTLNKNTYMKRLAYHNGRINLGTNNLKLDTLENLTEAYSVNRKMFITSGNSSDGGLSLYIPSNDTYTFPFGVGTSGLEPPSIPESKYTPATVVVTNFSDDGYLQINPVDHALLTLNGAPNNMLNYYWRVRYQNFTTVPDVQLTFKYYDSDCDPNDNSYRAGRVINYSVVENMGAGTVDDPGNLINFPSGALTWGDYTAGQNSAFSANVRKLYARKNGEWHDFTTWSTTRDGLNPLTNSGQLPGPGDICIIGTDVANYAVAVSQTHLDYAPIDIAMLVILRYAAGESSLVTVGQNGSDCNFSFVTNRDPDAANPESTASHASKIIISGPNLPSGDFGEFMAAPNTLWTYSRAFPGTNAAIDDDDGTTLTDVYYGSYTIGNSITEYPVLQFEYSGYSAGNIVLPSVDIVVNNDIRFWKGDQHIIFNNTTGGNVTVTNDIEFNGGTSWNIEFQGSGTARTLTVYGNIDFSSNAGTYSVENLGNPITHKISLQGNVINPAAGSDFNCYNGTGNANADFEFFGSQNSDFADMAGVPGFNQLIMNKGTDQTDTALVNSNLSLGGNTAGTSLEKPVQLQNGTLVFNNTNINLSLSTGSEDFDIPSTTSLEARLGTININGGTGIKLDGKLLVSGGTVDMTGGDNYIEYSAAGNATIEVTGGTLSVGSQVRRGLNSDQGILTFNQSGGTVNVGTDAAGEPNRGIFEILNTGSSFTQSAGGFYLVNDYRAGATTQSFYFNPETVSLSPGTEITFGNASSQPGSDDFTIYAGAALNSLIIDSTGTNSPTPSLTLEVVPLTLADSVSINAGTTFDANALNINISGNFNNAGTYTANGNTVSFVGSSDQIITGATTFYNLTKNTTNKLSLGTSSEITIDNLLSLEAGTFDDNDNNVNAKANVYSVITTSSAGTSNGIIMNGTTQQQISGSGTYARLAINNPTGAVVATGSTLTISENLKMQTGVLDIGRNLLVLNVNAGIEEASPFSESNMIQTNISFTDAGVRKFFPAISSLTTFVYPMGSIGKYTPVQLDITSCDGGSIRARAADERHISIIEDSEAPNPEIVDIDNVLQYHWTLDATGISGFSATATMESYPGDVMVTSPYTVADYITASLIDSTMGSWTKYSVADFNEATNELYFYFAGTDDLGIDGDYTAGIDDAIPNQVPSYISVINGPWNQAATWDTYPTGGSVPAGGPRGAIVYIEHEVTMPANFMAAYITNIRSAGIVNVGTTFGHRLGIVNGTGKIYLERGDMPAGVYDGFFAPDSGTIEFGGTTDYDILSEVTYVNNLTLSGTGQRRFPNLDLSIYGDWVLGNGVDNPTVIDEHNQMISIHKDIHFNSGSFDAGFGSNAIVTMAGSAHQVIYGNFTAPNEFYHFQMNNPAGVTLSSSDIEVSNDLILTSGVLFSTSANTITLTSLLENVVTGGSNSSHVSGPLFKNINNGGSFYYPVGNSGRYGEVLVQNQNGTAGYWQAQYYNQNPGSAGYDPTIFNAPLTMVSTGEYWRVQGPTATDLGRVGLRWDSQSGMPASDATSRSQLRIAEWRDINNDSPGTTTDDIWEEVDATNTVSGTSSAGAVTSNVDSNFDEFTVGNIFTLSSIYVAVNPTWNGSVSSVWNNASNWTPNAVPTSGDNIIIPTGMPNDPIIGIDGVCNAMDLQSGATLTINSGASLTLSGNLTMNGDISLLSDATGVGSLLDNGTITGTGIASVQRYTTGNSFHYLSSPLSAVPNTTFYTKVSPGDFNVNTNYYIYDETNNNTNWAYGWDNTSTSSGNMTIGRGYANWYDKSYTYTLTGGNFNTGNIAAAVTNTPNGVQSDGWNMIGNPYPSAVGADELIFANTGVIDGTLYFWDDDGTLGSGYDSNDYATWNLAGAIGTGNGASSSTGSKVPDGFITNGQAFFVHAHTSGNVNFTNSMRRIGNGQFFKSGPTNDVMRLRVSITNSTEKLYNEALLVFIQGATNGFDNNYDGMKLKGNSKIAFYSLLNNEEYAIQSFKPLDLRTNPVKEIPMGYKVTISGTYSFNLEGIENIGADVNVYLEDNVTSEFINLKEVQNYEFTTSAGTFDQRFVIRFNKIGEYSNSAPVLRKELADLSTLEDENFKYVVDNQTFDDLDANDKLSYSAKLTDGSQLPSWLTFNPESIIFEGVPENKDVDTITIELSATDNSGEMAKDIFDIEVENVNDAPELVNSIPDQEVDENADYEYTIPANTFIDVDPADEFTLSVKMADGSNLPNWLSFDSENSKLYGTASNPGNLLLSVIAADKAGADATALYTLTVKSATGINEIGATKIKFYPNPSKGKFYIESATFNENLRLIVHDNYGKVVHQQKTDGKNTMVDLTNLADGVYFIEITDGIGSRVYKLVLQR